LNLAPPAAGAQCRLKEAVDALKLDDQTFHAESNKRRQIEWATLYALVKDRFVPVSVLIEKARDPVTAVHVVSML